MNKEITLKINIPDTITFEDLMASRDKGARFIAYEYIIPRPLFPPIRRISKLFYLSPEENVSKYSFAYNLISLIWGWWGLPFGPSYTVNAIKRNKSGVDFTPEVFDNLNAHDFHKREVRIIQINAIFIPFDKDVLKEFNKVIKAISEKHTPFQSAVYIGKFIDTEEPYYIIGLREEDWTQKVAFQNLLPKYFYAHIRFDFVNLNEGTELTNKLITQGTKI